MATRVDGYEAEDDRKGVGRSSGGECLCAVGRSVCYQKVVHSRAETMMGNLVCRLAVAFRLRMRRPGGENG